MSTNTEKFHSSVDALFQEVESEQDFSDSIREVKKRYEVLKAGIEKQQTDAMLDDLSERVFHEISDKTKSTRERYDAFLKYLEQKEKEVGVKAAMETSVENMAENAKEKATSYAEEKAQQVADELGVTPVVEKVKGITSKITGFFDKFKMVGVYIGVALAPLFKMFGWELPKWMQADKKEEAKDEDKSDDISTGKLKGSASGTKDMQNQTTVDDDKEDKNTQADSVASSPEILDKQNTLSENFYYYTGINTLTHLAGIDLDKNDSQRESIRKFKNISLKQLGDIKQAGTFEQKDLTDVDNKFINALLGEKTQILLRSFLKKKLTELTLQRNEEALRRTLGTEYDTLLTSIKNNSFDFNNISINAISVLSVFSINSFSLLAIDGVKEQFSTIFKNFTGDNLDLDAISKDIKARGEGIISKELMEALNKNKNIFKLKADGNDTGIKQNLSSIAPETLPELEKLIVFKNFLLSDNFLGENSKTLLKKFGKEGHFKENLTYAGVIALYNILGGETNLDNIGVFDLPIMYKAISIIVGRVNPAYGSDYISSIAGYFLWNDSTIEVFHDPNDKDALRIISERVGIDVLGFWTRQVKEKLGYIGLFSDKYINDFNYIAGGVLIKRLGTKAIGKGAVLKGGALKKLGYFAIFAGIASAIHTTYNKGSQLFEELESFNKTESELENMSEGELQNYLNKAEALDKRMSTHTIELDGKKEQILLFSGRNGLEAIHDGKVYSLGVGFNRFGTIEEIGNNIMRTFGERGISFIDLIRDELPSEISEYISTKAGIQEYWKNDEREFKGQKYNFSKIQITETEVLVGEGQNILRVPIQDLLKQIVQAKEEHPDKLLSTNEPNKTITYKIIEPGSSDKDNLILLQQFTFEQQK